MSGAAGLTARSPLPAWGRVLIILLNSDEILKRSPLGSHPRQMKQRRTQLARGDAHVFLHLFRIFQFESQRAEAGIKEEDAETEGGGRGRGHRAKSRVTNGAVPVLLRPGAHRPRARQTPRCSLMTPQWPRGGARNRACGTQRRPRGAHLLPPDCRARTAPMGAEGEPPRAWRVQGEPPGVHLLARCALWSEAN